MCVLNAEVQVINRNRFLPLSSFLLYFHSEMHLSWLQVSSLVRRINAPLCRGNKVTQEKMVLEVHVEKGMQHGQKIVFEGQADEAVSKVRLHFF
jgi:hypothetical protein